MSIHILTGRPGQGKTYILTAKAIEFLRRGRNVYSNYFIDIEGIKGIKGKLNYFNKVQDFVLIKNGIIIMDEAQIYFNARNWEMLDERVQYKLQQHRHDGLDIWGTVQNLKRLDVIMRELVSNYYECKKMFATSEKSNKPFGLFILREYDVMDSEKPDERRVMFSFDWYWLTKEICKRYDTLKDITEFIEGWRSDRSIVEHKYKKCTVCGSEKRLS